MFLQIVYPYESYLRSSTSHTLVSNFSKSIGLRVKCKSRASFADLCLANKSAQYTIREFVDANNHSKFIKATPDIIKVIKETPSLFSNRKINGKVNSAFST